MELDGKNAPNVRFKLASAVVGVREINGQELPLAGTSGTLTDGALVTSFRGYQPKTFALKLAPATAARSALQSQPVSLKYDRAVATRDDAKTTGSAMDSRGNAYPAEMLPSTLHLGGVEFRLAPTTEANAVVAAGQDIPLPSGNFNRVYFLAASTDGDQKATFTAGSGSANLTIQDWSGFVGQWDDRVWKTPAPRNWAISAHHAVWPEPDFREREAAPPAPSYPADYVSLTPGYIKPAQIAWYASHIHTPEGLNQPYHYSYLYAYSLNLPAGAKALTLPKNDKIRVLAVSVANENPAVIPSQPLSDTLLYSSATP